MNDYDLLRLSHITSISTYQSLNEKLNECNNGSRKVWALKITRIREYYLLMHATAVSVLHESEHTMTTILEVGTE